MVFVCMHIIQGPVLSGYLKIKNVKAGFIYLSLGSKAELAYMSWGGGGTPSPAIHLLRGVSEIKQ